jgi:diacylglycerol diphosphate phosphatase/phosphatidate phosphatase
MPIREKARTPGTLNTGITTSSDPFAAPPLRVWLTTFWKDIFAMAIMGGIALGVHLAPPAPSRTFPITFKDGEIVMPQFAYEPRTQIIPVWAAVLLAGLVPIFFIALAQIRVRSWMDFVVGSIGLLQALITSSVFQVIIKCLIGGLRPHFLAACKPVVP